MNFSEPVQSPASQIAYRAWARASAVVDSARGDEIDLELQIKRLQSELRAARKVTKAARLVEQSAMRNYEATPYCEDGAA